MLTLQSHKKVHLWNRMWYNIHSTWIWLDTLAVCRGIFLLWELIALFMCRFSVALKEKTIKDYCRQIPFNCCLSCLQIHIPDVCFLELNLDFYDVIKWQLGSSDAFMSGAVGVICSHHDNVFKCRGDITESRARDCVGFLIVHALPLDFLTVITLLHIVTCRLGN